MIMVRSTSQPSVYKMMVRSTVCGTVSIIMVHFTSQPSVYKIVVRSTVFGTVTIIMVHFTSQPSVYKMMVRSTVCWTVSMILVHSTSRPSVYKMVIRSTACGTVTIIMVHFTSQPSVYKMMVRSTLCGTVSVIMVHSTSRPSVYNKMVVRSTVSIRAQRRRFFVSHCLCLENKTNDWVRSKIYCPLGPQGTSSGICQETETCMVRACHTPRQPLQNRPSGHFGGWATSWSAWEMLDEQRQTVDSPAHARTAHRGLMHQRLEEALC